MFSLKFWKYEWWTDVEVVHCLKSNRDEKKTTPYLYFKRAQIHFAIIGPFSPPNELNLRFKQKHLDDRENYIKM